MPELIDFASGRHVELHDQFFVGRSLDCSLVIEDTSISRKHCKFHLQCNKWYLTDMSSNGIFINDLKMRPNESVELKNMDCIQIAHILFGFKTQHEPVINYEDAEVVNLEQSVIEIEDSPKPEARAAAQVLLPTAAGLPNQPATSNSHDINFDDELTCSICAELFINAVTLNCQHSFCELCILKWRKNSKLCPICRHNITSQIHSLTINNMVSLVYATKSSEEKAIRNATIESRLRECCADAEPQSQTARGRGRTRGGRATGRGAAPRARGRARAVTRRRTRAAAYDEAPDAVIDVSSDSTFSDIEDSHLLSDWDFEMEDFFSHYGYFY